jgi:hypothetical protein
METCVYSDIILNNKQEFQKTSIIDEGLKSKIIECSAFFGGPGNILN